MESNKRKFSASNSNDIKYICNYVSLVLIEWILNTKYNINIKFNNFDSDGNLLNFVNAFEKKCPEDLKLKLITLSQSVISMLPEVELINVKQSVENVMSMQEVKEYMSNIVEEVYINNKDTFTMLNKRLNTKINKSVGKTKQR